jgi:hypothetical protein
MSLYVTPVMDPVVPELVLILIPFAEALMVEDEKVTVFTTLSVRPPTEPRCVKL